MFFCFVDNEFVVQKFKHKLIGESEERKFIENFDFNMNYVLFDWISMEKVWHKKLQNCCFTSVTPADSQSKFPFNTDGNIKEFISWFGEKMDSIMIWSLNGY